MNPTKVFWLTVIGLGIGGADQYYQVHMGNPFGPQYWIGMLFALLVPVGSYFIGLSQVRVSSSFNQPTPPPIYAPHILQERADKVAALGLPPERPYEAEVALLHKRLKDLQSYADHIASEAGIHKAMLDRVENPLGVRPWPYTPHLGDK
jgi:hypothetical protein